jgi:hypothetical protein
VLLQALPVQVHSSSPAAVVAAAAAAVVVAVAAAVAAAAVEAAVGAVPVVRVPVAGVVVWAQDYASDAVAPARWRVTVQEGWLQAVPWGPQALSVWEQLAAGVAEAAVVAAAAAAAAVEMVSLVMMRALYWVSWRRLCDYCQPHETPVRVVVLAAMVEAAVVAAAAVAAAVVVEEHHGSSSQVPVL